MAEKEIPVAGDHELQRLQWKPYYLFAKPCVYYASIYLVGGLSPHLHEEIKTILFRRKRYNWIHICWTITRVSVALNVPSISAV